MEKIAMIAQKMGRKYPWSRDELYQIILELHSQLESQTAHSDRLLKQQQNETKEREMEIATVIRAYKRLLDEQSAIKSIILKHGLADNQDRLAQQLETLLDDRPRSTKSVRNLSFSDERNVNDELENLKQQTENLKNELANKDKLNERYKNQMEFLQSRILSIEQKVKIVTSSCQLITTETLQKSKQSLQKSTIY